VRVLHLHSGNIYGGIEALLVTLARHQAAAPEVQHDFALCFDGRFSRSLTELGSNVFHLGPARMRNPLSGIGVRRRMQELIGRDKHDVVIRHSTWAQVMFGAVRGLTQVFWLHGEVGASPWLERLARRVRPDAGICCSQFVAENLSRLYPSLRHRVIYAPVAPPEPGDRGLVRARVRRDIGVSPETAVIVQVSRMELRKGHYLHLEALARMRDRPGWVCWFVGGAHDADSRDLRGELERTCAELGLRERVAFLGERSDVGELLTAADIFCQPNLAYEGLPISLVEAMHAALPIVSSKVGGIEELVDEGSGVLIDVGNCDQLVDVLTWLVADKARRQALGQGAQMRADALCNPVRQTRQIASYLIEASGTQRAPQARR
jgi:glycosyltransferase involved in cell wall biosynthesis